MATFTSTLSLVRGKGSLFLGPTCQGVLGLGNGDNDEDDYNCHNDDDNLKRWNLGSVYKLLLSLRLMMVITVLVTLAVFGVTFMMIIFLFH